MIYGYPGDGNLSRLINTMRRWPVTPLPGDGRALQQPVYYQALAKAAVAALGSADRHPRRCAVAGPQPVTQRTLFRAAAHASGARCLIVPAPLGAVAPLVKVIEQFGIKPPLSSAQIARTGLDKTPVGEHVILTDTSLETGLAKLVQAMDAETVDQPS